MEKDLICIFTEMLSQLRILHWQTESYARHIAYEKIYENLEDYVDEFIEAYQGKNGRIKIVSQPQIMNIDDDNVNGFANEHIDFLSNGINEFASEEDVDLLAIRDEMVKELNILKYLLTLE